VVDQPLALKMKRGETRRWDLALTNDDGTALAGTFSNPRTEWRYSPTSRPVTDADPCEVAFNTAAESVATGTATITFIDPAWVLTLAIDNSQSKLVTPRSYIFDVWADLDGEPICLLPGKAKVDQNITAVEA
jgi:hypothetical protein